MVSILAATLCFLPSDVKLHLKVGQQYISFQFPVCVPNLILASDVGRLADYQPYLDFFCGLCDQYVQVLLVLGSHEIFGLLREEGLRLSRSLESEATLSSRLVVRHRTRVL